MLNRRGRATDVNSICHRTEEGLSVYGRVRHVFFSVWHLTDTDTVPSIEFKLFSDEQVDRSMFETCNKGGGVDTRWRIILEYGPIVRVAANGLFLPP